MKKYFLLVVCITLILVGFSVFTYADGSSNLVDENILAKLTGTIPDNEALKLVTGSNTSDADVEKLAKLDKIDEITTKLDQISSEINSVSDITAQNAPQLMSSIFQYLKARDVYFKFALKKLDEIKANTDTKIAGAAAVKYYSNLEMEKEKYRNVTSKYESLIKFLDTTEGKVLVKENTTVRMLFRASLEKYSYHRTVLTYLFKNAAELKSNLNDNTQEKLIAYADKIKSTGKIALAEKFYEEALKNTDSTSTKSIFSKIGNLNKVLKKTAPTIFVKNSKVTAPTEPVIKNGVTLVPMRAISEALNCDVGWNQKTKIVTVKKGAKIITLPINSKIVDVDGKKVTIEVPATVLKGTTLVPIRLISESLDAKVDWYQTEKIISISDNYESDKGTEQQQESVDTGIVSTSYLDTYVNNKTEQEIITEILATDETEILQ